MRGEKGRKWNYEGEGKGGILSESGRLLPVHLSKFEHPFLPKRAPFGDKAVMKLSWTDLG